jgi:hypothetical protein
MLEIPGSLKCLFRQAHQTGSSSRLIEFRDRKKCILGEVSRVPNVLLLYLEVFDVRTVFTF